MSLIAQRSACRTRSAELAKRDFGAGLEGRFREGARYTEHVALEGTYPLEVPDDGEIVTRDIPLRRAMNELLRGRQAHRLRVRQALKGTR